MSEADATAVLAEEVLPPISADEAGNPSAEGLGADPPLETDASQPAVLVPVPTIQPPLERPTADAPSGDPRAEAVAPAVAQRAPAAETKPNAGPARPQLKLGRKPLTAPVSPTASKNPAPVKDEPVKEQPAGTEAPASPPSLSGGQRVYQFLDALLAFLHWPFSWVPASVRNFIGLLALATLAMSLLAMTLLPTLFPRRDALTFLTEKRAEQLKPKPVAPEKKEEGAAHGDEKKPAHGEEKGAHGGH